MELKKSALALLALGLTGVASAGGFMPAPACSNHPVTVPCERSAWDVGVTAMWARPSSDFTLFDINNDDVDSRSSNFYQDLDHRFGFGLEASYHWGTGNDFTVAWNRFHRSYSWTDTSSSFNALDISVHFDSLNFELGQHIDVGPTWDLRTHMGLQYMKLELEADQETAETMTALSNGDFGIDTVESKVEGFGPRFGFDLAYHVSDGFSVVGHSAIALLAGERNNYWNYVGYDNSIVDSVDPGETGEHRGVVLGVEGKLGLAYTSTMSQGSLTVEGGYSVATYHNGIDIVGFISQPFNMDGWYLTAKFVS